MRARSSLRIRCMTMPSACSDDAMSACCACGLQRGVAQAVSFYARISARVLTKFILVSLPAQNETGIWNAAWNLPFPSTIMACYREYLGFRARSNTNQAGQQFRC